MFVNKIADLFLLNNLSNIEYRLVAVLEKKLHNTFKLSYYNEWYPFSMYQEILDFLEKNH